jgi:IclR family acetate operon transcriptional repressor
MAQGAQTADRAIQILLLVATSGIPLGVAEIGRLTGLNRAATYRLLQPLLNHGLLEREPDGRGYVAGTGLLVLSARVLQKANIIDAARPAMQRLVNSTSETVSLHVRTGDERVCIASIDGPHPVRRVVPVGEKLDLSEGVSGKVILAYLSAAEAAAIIGRAAENGRDEPQLRQRIADVRAYGSLAEVGNPQSGVSGISAPIFDGFGVAGSLTVSGPSDRLTPAVMASIAELVVQEADRVSAALGFSEKTEPAGSVGGEITTSGPGPMRSPA